MESAEKEEKERLEVQLLKDQIEKTNLEKGKLVAETNDLRRPLWKKQFSTIFSIFATGAVLFYTVYRNKDKEALQLIADKTQLISDKYELQKNVDSLDSRKSKLNDSINILNEQSNILKYNLEISSNNQKKLNDEFLQNEIHNTIIKNNLNNEIGSINEKLENKSNELLFKPYEFALQLLLSKPTPISESDSILELGLHENKIRDKIIYEIENKFINQDTNLEVKAYGLRFLTINGFPKYYVEWVNLLKPIIRKFRTTDEKFPKYYIDIYSYNLRQAPEILYKVLEELSDTASVYTYRAGEILTITSRYLSYPDVLNETNDTLLINIIASHIRAISLSPETKKNRPDQLMTIYKSLANICIQPLLVYWMDDLYRIKYYNQPEFKYDASNIFDVLGRLNSYQSENYGKIIEPLHMDTVIEATSDTEFYKLDKEFSHLWKSQGFKWVDPDFKYFIEHPAELKRMILNNEF